jgi:maltose O-acetyltransferase
MDDTKFKTKATKKTSYSFIDIITKIRMVFFDEIRTFQPRFIFINFITKIIPYYTGTRLRTYILKVAGINIGHGTFIMGTPHMHGFGDIRRRLRIGHDAVININCFFDLNAPIVIGNHAALGHEVMLITSSHQIGDKDHRAGHLRTAPITIEDGAWIGSRSTILPGITIGAGSIVAAGSVVTKDVLPHTLVGGVPARMIRNID